MGNQSSKTKITEIIENSVNIEIRNDVENKCNRPKVSASNVIKFGSGDVNLSGKCKIEQTNESDFNCQATTYIKSIMDAGITQEQMTKLVNDMKQKDITVGNQKTSNEIYKHVTNSANFKNLSKTINECISNNNFKNELDASETANFTCDKQASVVQGNKDTMNCIFGTSMDSENKVKVEQKAVTDVLNKMTQEGLNPFAFLAMSGASGMMCLIAGGFFAFLMIATSE